MTVWDSEYLRAMAVIGDDEGRASEVRRAGFTCYTPI